MIKVTTKLNMSFPEIATQDWLEQVMEKVIKPDIEARMRAGVDINGGNHKANTQATINAKLKKNLSTKVPLIATGQLQKSFRIKLEGDTKVSLSPLGTRYKTPGIGGKRKEKGHTATIGNNELGSILQNDKGYNFFGISAEAETKSIQYVAKLINKAIRNGK